MRPPTTHTNWNRVSNCANARPRTASGPSRCSRLSNPSRPPAAPIASAIAVSPNPATPPTSAPSTANTAGSTSADATMISSRNDLRSTGAAITPMNPPMPARDADDTEREQVVLERERGEEQQEADAAAEHCHRAAGEEDARLVELGPLELLLALVGGLAQLRPRDLRRQDRSDHEDDRGEPQ